MRLLAEGYFQNRGNIMLPGMEVTFKLPDGVAFRYDGAVGCLAENLARTELIIRGEIDLSRSCLERVLNWPIEKIKLLAATDCLLERKPELASIAAYCFPHRVGMYKAFVLAKKRWLEKSKSIFADGHESGEFLGELGAVDFLQEILQKEKIDLRVRDYEGEEFADIGGLLAIRNAIRSGVKGVCVPVFRTREQVLPEQIEAFGL